MQDLDKFLDRWSTNLKIDKYMRKLNLSIDLSPYKNTQKKTRAAAATLLSLPFFITFWDNILTFAGCPTDSSLNVMSRMFFMPARLVLLSKLRD